MCFVETKCSNRGFRDSLGQRWDRKTTRAKKRETKREREREREGASSFGSILALLVINNTECQAPISQVDSVPARTLYTKLHVCKKRKREKERKNNWSSIGPVRVSGSTHGEWACLGPGGFHSHALKKRRRERGRMGKRVQVRLCAFRLRGRLHNLLTPMENKSSPRDAPALSTFTFNFPARIYGKYKQIVDHFGDNRSGVPWIPLNDSYTRVFLK